MNTKPQIVLLWCNWWLSYRLTMLLTVTVTSLTLLCGRIVWWIVIECLGNDALALAFQGPSNDVYQYSGRYTDDQNVCCCDDELRLNVGHWFIQVDLAWTCTFTCRLWFVGSRYLWHESAMNLNQPTWRNWPGFIGLGMDHLQVDSHLNSQIWYKLKLLVYNLSLNG